jgi:hypothetical protein
LERVEFRFEGTMGLAPLSSYTGFLVIGDQLRSLPIGSTLDTKGGIFTWQPGPGFYGTGKSFTVLAAKGKKIVTTVFFVDKYTAMPYNVRDDFYRNV